jgi:phage/plasmid-associated DNA primase
MTSTPLFVPTLLRWYNSAPDDRGRCSKIASADVGPYESIPYGTSKPGEVHANGKPPHPQYGQWQTGLSLSRTSRTVVVDVDDYDAYKLSDLELLLPVNQPTSYRVAETGLKLHFVIVVPEELLHLYPKQGSTPWGDIKANGFSYITGVHYTGSEYKQAGNAFVTADQELLEAIAAEPRAQVGGQSNGGSAGAWAEPGYGYANGEKHVRGVADVASMINAGLTDVEIDGFMSQILYNSEGYVGHGEEISGWISSARRKYDIAEGESWASKEDDFYAGLFGRDCWELRKVSARGEAQAASVKHQAQLEYLCDPVAFIAAQVEDEDYTAPVVPDLRGVPLGEAVNPAGVRIEPAGTTDYHLARQILIATTGMIRYASDAGCWLRNEGHSWTEWGTKSEAVHAAKALTIAWGSSLKSEDEITREAEALAQAARAEWERMKEAGELTDDQLADPPPFTLDSENEDYKERVKRLQANRKRVSSNDGTNAIASMVVAEAKIAPEYGVRVADLDAEPRVLWAGGVPWSLLHTELTVATGANPVHLKNCPVAPVPGPHPLWDEAVEALFPDPEIRQWAVRELAGAALWGATSKQHPVLDGKPNAGKSTVTDTIRKILGTYAVDIDPNKLIGGSENSSTEEEKAAMIGARMVLLDEPPKRDRQSISQFNRIASGTGEIAASAKYKNRVSAPKRFNMVINQNHRNRMRLDVEGVRQRLVFIPADGHIPVEMYKRFNAGVQAEYPAILTTLIRECALFHTGHRLDVPLTAQMAVDGAYADGDEFQQWLLSSYEIPVSEPSKTDEDRMHTIDVIRKAYAEHARLLPGVNAITRSELRDRLASMNVRIKDHGGSLGKKRNVILLYPLPVAQAYQH